MRELVLIDTVDEDVMDNGSKMKVFIFNKELIYYLNVMIMVQEYGNMGLKWLYEYNSKPNQEWQF